MPRAPFLEGMAPSATLAINERTMELLAEGREVARFGLGPVPAHMVAALRAAAHEKDYLPVAGLPALREAVAAWHRRVDGLDAQAHQVFIGPGSKELLFTVQMVFAGELLVTDSCWVSYAPQARIAGRPCVALPTDFEGRWRLKPQVLDAHCRANPGVSRLLILNSPGNPDGLHYSAGELGALAEVLRRHQVLVISDEIYGPVHHKGEHISMARFYPEGTMVSGGLSKWAGAGGWRLGTLLVPDALAWVHEAMRVVASETFSAVAAPIQYGAVAAYGPHPQMDAYLEDCRATLIDAADRAVGPLRAAGVRIHDPTGAFYFLGELSHMRDRFAARGIHDGATMCRRLLDEAGVAILPGSDFLRPPGELSFRLAYVDLAGLDTGIARMADWIAG
jgi:aspartate aminotransferase